MVATMCVLGIKLRTLQEQVLLTTEWSLQPHSELLILMPHPWKARNTGLHTCVFSCSFIFAFYIYFTIPSSITWEGSSEHPQLGCSPADAAEEEPGTNPVNLP